MTVPEKGTVLFYDAIRGSLTPGEYRALASVDVTFAGGDGHVTGERYFNVEAPRFTLPPPEVSGVYPPRNARGAFHTALPHVTLGRRSLPWERSFGAPPPAPGAGDPAPPPGELPWLALLLFEASECELLPGLPLDQVVPADVFVRLGSPAGVVCDAVEVRTALLSALAPAREELGLLTHVRRVNVEDRELAAGDSDGWFAVVTCARLPRPGRTYVACLVSIEQRLDVVALHPPAVASSGRANAEIGALSHAGLLSRAPDRLPPPQPRPDKTRLVLLHSWRFETSGTGTFRELAQRLDVAMLGSVSAAAPVHGGLAPAARFATAPPPPPAGIPPVTDTGHIPIRVTDRDGAAETAWYRGPLVPHPLTRDPLGPYHSADQARRVAPETGAEDITYAAAFEVGRLLAASDGRLAQELLRYRRAAYRDAVRGDLMAVVRAGVSVPPVLSARLESATSAVVATGILAGIAAAPGPLADPSGLGRLQQAPGLLPERVADAYSISVVEAAELLSGTSLGREAPVAPAPATGSVRDVPAADIERLVAERARSVAALTPPEESP